MSLLRVSCPIKFAAPVAFRPAAIRPQTVFRRTAVSSNDKKESSEEQKYFNKQERIQLEKFMEATRKQHRQANPSSSPAPQNEKAVDKSVNELESIFKKHNLKLTSTLAEDLIKWGQHA